MLTGGLSGVLTAVKEEMFPGARRSCRAWKTYWRFMASKNSALVFVALSLSRRNSIA